MTFCLVIGLVVVNVLQPGKDFPVPANLDAKSVEQFTGKDKLGTVAFLLGIIPETVVGAFAKGDILQVLLFALLFGSALSHMGAPGQVVKELIDRLAQAIFGIVNMLMKLAPIGAFGAMAYTIGTYGIGSLKSLGWLMGGFYLTCGLFVFVVLGLIAKFLGGFNIFRFIAYIKEELLLVLGTSSSEPALPLIMEKLEKLGCGRPVVGLVIPTGYSFNLDGTNIYMTMAAIFVAQATNTELTLTEQLTVLGVAMLTSKGASGITGSGFITLAATLAALPKIPVAGMALILGIDRFMSEMRALTNFIGNGVATIVVARWENELNLATLNRELSGDPRSEHIIEDERPAPAGPI